MYFSDMNTSVWTFFLEKETCLTQDSNLSLLPLSVYLNFSGLFGELILHTFNIYIQLYQNFIPSIFKLFYKNMIKPRDFTELEILPLIF